MCCRHPANCGSDVGDHTAATVIATITRLLGSRSAQARAELLPALGISPATLARLIEELKGQVLTMGKGRATRYALRRPVAGLPEAIPIYEVLPSGKSQRLGSLAPVQPKGYFFQSSVEGVSSSLNVVLPYFLNDMRPQGYLGRVVPRRHPELELPADIRLWDSDAVLRYLTRYGWSTTGNLIVGDEAFDLHMRDARDPRGVVEGKVERYYENAAADALGLSQAGSFAGGEQPKFLTRRAEDGASLIVKFSPPTGETIGRRVADLLDMIDRLPS